MRFSLAFLLILLTSCIHIPQLTPVEYTPKPHHRLVLDKSVQAFLDAAWDSVNVYQVERVYCVDKFTYKVFDDSTDGVVVKRIVPGIVGEAKPSSISYNCSKPYFKNDPTSMVNIPSIHTHPPSNCYYNDKFCVYDDWRRIDCQPSEIDEATSWYWGMDFSIVQCWKGKYTMFGFTLPK